jgi:hypothetical protein
MAALSYLAADNHWPESERFEMVRERVDWDVDGSLNGSGSVLLGGADIDDRPALFR